MSSWRRKVFDAPGLTQAPPGQYLEKLARRWKRKIYVTSSWYDDIGKVLDAMGVAFEPFPGAYDCDLLFVNCGTRDQLNLEKLRGFVHAGGCLYASDLTSSLIVSAFPAARRTPYAGRPLMVEVAHGEGAIFYTSFHNRAQVSKQEKVLLQLLVLKQISASSKTTVAQASQSLGISLSALRRKTN
jgi:hypothetical protein